MRWSRSWVEIVRSESGMLHCLQTADLERLATACGVELSSTGPTFFRALARLYVRSKVWGARKKAELSCSYSRERTEEVLASFLLPPDIAEEAGLAGEHHTWLDAVRLLSSVTCPLELWRRVETHPICQVRPCALPRLRPPSEGHLPCARRSEPGGRGAERRGHRDQTNVMKVTR